MADATNPVVTQALRAEFASGTAMTVVARYDTRDPLAVVFRFDRRRKGVVDWEFSRDLLVEALLWGHAGDGDVQFLADKSSVDWLWLVLDSPTGHAELRMSAAELRALAARMEQLVPGDSGQIDWDVELRHLAEWGVS